MAYVRRDAQNGSVTEHADNHPAPVQPARDHRAAETAMKAVLLVAAIVGGLFLLFAAVMIGPYVLSS
ncbi:hypothetical protein SAMN05216268_10419 [Streptomyces yunnanensis]|uniref:Uncharacterized protein n=2 Tax=Streptomyces TaxID=1883 RepID=A0A2N8PGG7_STRNR|nr:hypothetical protein AOB60_03435 [Streptomyces noursei]SHL35146.1 hypothetical protein SAMN05216268_10419 [Streptomyces yunnanensis]